MFEGYNDIRFEIMVKLYNLEEMEHHLGTPLTALTLQTQLTNHRENKTPLCRLRYSWSYPLTNHQPESGLGRIWIGALEKISDIYETDLRDTYMGKLRTKQPFKFYKNMFSLENSQF